MLTQSELLNLILMLRAQNQPQGYGQGGPAAQGQPAGGGGSLGQIASGIRAARTGMQGYNYLSGLLSGAPTAVSAFGTPMTFGVYSPALGLGETLSALSAAPAATAATPAATTAATTGTGFAAAAAPLAIMALPALLAFQGFSALGAKREASRQRVNAERRRDLAAAGIRGYESGDQDNLFRAWLRHTPQGQAHYEKASASITPEAAAREWDMIERAAAQAREQGGSIAFADGEFGEIPGISRELSHRLRPSSLDRAREGRRRGVNRMARILAGEEV